LLDADREEQLAIFNMLRISSDKLGETIANLNDIITMQNNVEKGMTDVNLRQEVETTCHAINAMISETDTKIENCIPEDVTVKVVPSYLESILLNLLSNGIKYRSPERKSHIKVSAEETEGSYVLTIQDNGIGIDMTKNGKKLFGMYKTFNNNKDARGIGLFITKNQVEAMNGKIEAHSILGKGSTFNVHLSKEHVRQ